MKKFIFLFIFLVVISNISAEDCIKVGEKYPIENGPLNCCSASIEANIATNINKTCNDDNVEYLACIYCGDGICDTYENECNCEKDCKLNFCDEDIPCSYGSCYKYENNANPLCVEGDPCDNCANNKCSISESNPPIVRCLDNPTNCDINTPCEVGDCYTYDGNTEPICIEEDPCSLCASGKCEIQESYPMKVKCLGSEILCDDNFNCEKGDCYLSNDITKPICLTTDPCNFCVTGKCNIDEGTPNFIECIEYCTDSDNFDLFIKGEITELGEITNVDECNELINGDFQPINKCNKKNCYIHEFECNSDTYQKCDYGCNNGACKKPNFIRKFFIYLSNIFK